MNVSVRVREYVWSAHSTLIQLKRYKNIQQRAPLENTVMQIASSDIFTGLDKDDSDSPKVSSARKWKLIMFLASLSFSQSNFKIKLWMGG